MKCPPFPPSFETSVSNDSADVTAEHQAMWQGSGHREKAWSCSVLEEVTVRWERLTASNTHRPAYKVPD